MGEVYRAHDQRLGQSVALKFLPTHLALDPTRRAQFKNEVLVARQVTHPNVCRVHDYDELDGQPFLSMEYIDGEDLASLLKRIRRLPEDTAVELARQLCLGLAAAHEQGLLHRDLKPQNVMIDGRGQARITDFGLAGRIGSFSGIAVRAGTPLYQAPEQLTGTEVNERSDIYSLGLVLYEMFTGKRAYQAATVAELVRLHRDGTPATPASHVPTLNPAVERVILKCLEPDPANRPRSVIEVLREVPGGKLEEAIFKGQTPSPRDVSEAGPEGSLTTRVGVALFGLALTGILLAAWLNDYAALFRQVPQERSPRDLSREARLLLEKLGYEERADSASGLATDEPLLSHLRATAPDQRHQGFGSGQPAVMYFWYRQGPQPLTQRLAANDTSGWSMPGRVLPNEPPLRDPGMVCVFLDLEARLLELHAVPPREPPGTASPALPDPRALLDAAGFAADSLHETNEFRRVPPVFADRQMAWEGFHPKAPTVAVRVEAAFYRGTPVYFHVAPAGLRERLQLGSMPDNPGESLQEVKNTILGLIALPIGGWFAWRNWKLRRANPRGASILAGCFVVLGLLGWLLAAKHVLRPENELSMFTAVLGRALFDGLLLWLAYLALEPWVRRTSPVRVISWNRLLAGRWGDPLVGRDVLLGVVAAAVFVPLLLTARALPGWLGHPADPKLVWDATFTEGAGGLLLTVQIALLIALRYFFLYFLLLLVCRRGSVALVAVVVIWAVPYAHGGEYPPVRVVAALVFAVVNILVLRVGLLTFIAFNVTEEVLIYLPVTIRFSAWYAGVSTMSLLLVAGLATYGFWAACRHRALDADRVRD